MKPALASDELRSGTIEREPGNGQLPSWHLGVIDRRQRRVPTPRKRTDHHCGSTRRIHPPVHRAELVRARLADDDQGPSSALWRMRSRVVRSIGQVPTPCQLAAGTDRGTRCRTQAQVCRMVRHRPVGDLSGLGKLRELPAYRPETPGRDPIQWQPELTNQPLQHREQKEARLGRVVAQLGSR